MRVRKEVFYQMRPIKDHARPKAQTGWMREIWKDCASDLCYETQIKPLFSISELACYPQDVIEKKLMKMYMQKL